MVTIPHLKAAALASVVGMLFSTHAPAQIATDGSLGSAGALAGPQYAITAGLGRQVGANLFHSFSTFNLANGESATFSGPGGIANIISRVTGGGASSIDGLLRSTIAGANLFLVNPSGILFGPNASLDLTGSFHASTANYLKLADGTRFDATAPGPGDSLLTSAPPAAFGFLGSSPAPITVSGSSLSVPEGKSLSLLGGAVNLADATLRTVAGDIRVVAIGGAGEVPLDATGASLTGATLAPISVERSTLATESGAGSAPGRIVIRGGRITLLDSTLASTNRDIVDAPPIEIAASGDVTVSASNVTSTAEVSGRGADLSLSGRNLTVDHNAQITADTWTDGPGGSINLTASAALQVKAAPEDPNYTNVYTFAFGAGAAGDIRMTGDTVSVKSANLFSGTMGIGDSGSLVLRGRDISIIDGAWLYTYNLDSGSARSGNIDIAAAGRFLVSGADWADNFTHIFTQSDGPGRGGDILVKARDVVMTGGAIVPRAHGAGNGGSLRITSDTLRAGGTDLLDSVISSEVGYLATGNGGDITIDSPSITFEAHSLLWSVTNGVGNGGNILVRTHDIETRAGSALFTDTAPWATGGKGGNFTLEGTGRLTMGTHPVAPFAHWILTPDDVGVGAFSAGPGRSGDVTISIPEIRGSGGSYFVAFAKDSGDAGNITINAQRVSLTDKSVIQVWAINDYGGRHANNAGNIVLNIGESFEMSSGTGQYTDQRFGQTVTYRGGIRMQSMTDGNAGSLVINAPRIVLDDARVEAATWLSGNGGRIEINTDAMTMRNGARIDTKAMPGSTGNAGSILINARDRLDISGMSAVDGAFSGISAQTWGSGDGGEVRIRTGDFLVDRGYVKSSTAGAGAAGSIDIQARRVALSSGAAIDAGTAQDSTGAGGNIRVNASDSITVSGVDRNPIIEIPAQPAREPAWAEALGPGRTQGASPSAISSSTAGSGTGGNLDVNAPRIIIEDGGRINANSSAGGSAGSIYIQAPDWLKLSSASITTEALASDGGNIDIRAGNMVYLKDSQISTSVGGGSGNGGNIFIDPTFVVLDNSRIAANAFGGAGGSISIIADYFLTSPDSTIEASSQLGVSGSVQIAAPRTDPGSALARLPTGMFDAAGLLRASCAGRAGPRASSLMGVGRGGLAAAPDRLSTSHYFASSSPGLIHGSQPATFAESRVLAAAVQSARLAGCAH